MTSIKDWLVGRKKLQSLFERLHRISLRGMNYGLGGMISTSGETNLSRIINNQLNKLGIRNKVIFDVGANDGKYAEMLMGVFSEDDTIYCLEPSKASFRRLFERYGSKKNVTLAALGLGSNREKRMLYFDQEGSGWASVYERESTEFNFGLNQSEEIEIVTLDEFCKDNGLSSINFLKADVEGFELEIFRGAKNMLPAIDFIQFEFSFANRDSNTYLLDFFRVLSDFRIYRILQDGIQEVNYDPRYEIFLTTNYLAINKRILKRLSVIG